MMDKRDSATEGKIITLVRKIQLIKWSDIEEQRNKVAEQLEWYGVRRALSC
jgi:hypothetical protein